jgi:hypothetical protein
MTEEAGAEPYPAVSVEAAAVEGGIYGRRQ